MNVEAEPAVGTVSKDNITLAVASLRSRLSITLSVPAVRSSAVGPSNQKNSAGELAEIVKKCVGYEGQIRYNTNYPDGTPQKLLDVSTLSTLGWTANIDLRAGIDAAYKWFQSHAA